MTPHRRACRTVPVYSKHSIHSSCYVSRAEVLLRVWRQQVPQKDEA